jgi:thioredoxin-dependent peroxiredoxin
MLQPGTQAPDFTLEDQYGHEVTLAKLLDEGPLILYFYPADFTPGCTAEACMLRDLHTDIQLAGLRVVGISPQDRDSHSRFKQQHDLPFTLLSDPDKKVIKLYDLDGPLGFGVRRGTYLLSPHGTIEDGVLADFRIGRHEEFIRRAVVMLRGLETGAQPPTWLSK